MHLELGIDARTHGSWMHVWSNNQSLHSSWCEQCPRAIRPRASLTLPLGEDTLKNHLYGVTSLSC